MGQRVSLGFGYTGYFLNNLYGYGEKYFEHIKKLDPHNMKNDIRHLVDTFDPQLIHSHNAPNTLTLAALDVAEAIPVIHDVHEVLSVHNSGFKSEDDEEKLSKYRKEERIANEKSNGRIYPTLGIRDFIQQHYDVNVENDFVFQNYVSESLMPKHFRKKLSNRDSEIHIVYVGCITSVVEGHHYDLRKIFRILANHGMHIHIYPTSNIITLSNSAYMNLSKTSEFIHFHDTMNRKELLKEITQYDFGWVGLNREKNGKHIDLILPNKIMDYVASGLPILAFPHETIQRFVETNDVGLIFNDIGEIEGLLRNTDPSTMKEHVLNMRSKITIEHYIERVINFYKKVISGS